MSIEELAAEIIDKTRKLVNAPGYQHGQITELRLLIAEYDEQKGRSAAVTQ